MICRRQTKVIHEGQYAAEVEVDLMEAEEEGWPPYLSLADAENLDEVWAALRRGDLHRAGQLPQDPYSNHILTASESNFKMLESMGLLDVLCQPCVREGEGMLEGSVGGEAT